MPFGLTSKELRTSVPATLSVDETSPTGCRKSSGLLQINCVVLPCWQQETQSECPESWFHLHGATCKLLLSWLLIETLKLSTCCLSYLLSPCLVWRHHTAHTVNATFCLAQLLNLMPQQPTVPDFKHFNFLLYFAKPYLWQETAVSVVNVLHSFLSPPHWPQKPVVSVTHCSDHTHLSKSSVCKTACLTLLFHSPAP